MFILIDVGGTGLMGEDFAWGLLDEAKVAVMPGPSFGDEARNFVRISLTVPDEDIAEACRRIVAFAEGLAASGKRRLARGNPHDQPCLEEA